ncbi:MAG: TerD family protein [Proteobacteria bacterium]|nr:TerD family protein [Pseudomonadota bacterium]
MLQKSASEPLQYTKKARHRITCGLSWDIKVRNRGFVEKLVTLSSKKQEVKLYDLDLACVMYDGNGEFVDGVSSRPDEAIDMSGAVYHSGDDDTGRGGGDDEQISVELASLPESIHHIVFVVEVQSKKHNFSNVGTAEIRIADGMDDRTQFTLLMGETAESADKTACVPLRVYREDGNWMIQNIGAYYNSADVSDWTEEIKKFIA